MAAAHSDFPLHISFSFLEKVRDSMEGTYKTNRNPRDLKAYVLKEMDYFSTNPEADKLRGLKKKVSDVTDIMKENIEKVIDRGEKLEDLEDQTDVLRTHAEMFHEKSRDMRCAMIRNNYKMLAVAIVVFVVILIIMITGLWLSGAV